MLDGSAGIMQFFGMKKSAWQVSLRILAAGSKISSFAPILLVSLWVLRMGYVGGRLAWACPEGPGSVWGFAGIAVLAIFGPGLFLTRALRVECGSFSTRLLLTVVASLGVSVLFAWNLYFFGLFTRPALLAGLGLAAAGGLHGLRGLAPVETGRRLAERWRALSAAERWGLALGLLFLQGLFEANVGRPMTAWDAVVSWDKWAVDMAARAGLGQYVMGGYPQFFPTLHSLFYKIAGRTAADVLPAEHLLLHGFCAIHAALLMLSLWCLGRRLRAPGLLVFLVFAGNRTVFSYLSAGYVDVPLAAMACAACALIVAYRDGIWKAGRGRSADAGLLFPAFFAVAFMKGNGLIWVALLAGYLIAPARDRRRTGVALGAAALAALAVAPFYAQQMWYTRHFDLAEKSPFLHAFRLVPAHTTLFTPDAAHARLWLGRLLADYGIPGSLSAWAAGIGLCLCAWALARRRLAFFAASGVALFAVWFYTGSYDFRNALVPLLFLIFAMAGALFDLPVGKRGGRIRAGLCAGAVALWVFRGAAAPLQEVFLRPLRPFPVPEAFALEPGARHLVVWPWGEIRKLIFDTPFGQRAAHVNSGFWGLYRLLAPRGTYALNANSYNDARRFDLLIREEEFMELPAGFEPVAVLRRMGPRRSLCLFKPEFRTLQADIRAAETPEVPLADPGAPLAAGRAYVATLADDAAAPDAERPRDGVISVRISPPGADVSVRLHPDDALRDPHASYFAPIRAGDCIRLLYWMRAAGPALPRLAVETGAQDVRLTAVEWGQ